MYNHSKQTYQHQMTAVQAVGRCMGWQLLASSAHLGSGPVEPLGNASSCLLASPNGNLMHVFCLYSSQPAIACIANLAWLSHILEPSGLSPASSSLIYQL